MKTYLPMFVIVLSFALLSCSQEQKSIEPQNQNPQQQSPQAELNDASNSQAQPMNEKTTQALPTSNCSLKIGFDVWEPYQYLDVNHTVQGLDIELVSAVTESMNCQVEYVQGTWVTLLEALKNGEVDMLLGASKTQAREEFAFFSMPYRMEEFALYIRTDDPTRAAYPDIDTFIQNGSKIGVVSDYFYGQKVSDLLDNPDTAQNFVFGIMGELNIARLLDMDIDGFLEDSFVGASILRRKALHEYIVAHGYTIKTGDIYVMFSRASVDEQTLTSFNQAMTAFKASSAYVEIVAKYGTIGN